VTLVQNLFIVRKRSRSAGLKTASTIVIQTGSTRARKSYKKNRRRQGTRKKTRAGSRGPAYIAPV